MNGVRSRQEKGFVIAGHVVMIILTILALAPFILLVSASFTDNDVAIKEGYSFIPKLFSLEAYRYIAMEWAQIGRAYGMTIFVTVVGTVLSILIVSLLAYALAQNDVPGMKILIVLIVFTMLFNGGMVSSYMVYTKIFHIKNTVWALLFPSLLMNGVTVMLVKNYIVHSIPKDLTEAAEIDGCSQIKLFFKIVMPLATPILATVGLLAAVAYWNDWTNGLYYIDDTKLYTVQLLLNEMNNNVQFLTSNPAAANMMNSSEPIPSASIRMAIAVVGILPIVVIYPFFQKYFAQGITMGAVKG